MSPYGNVNPLVTSQEEPFCLFIKKNIAYLTYGRPLRTLKVTSVDILKRLFQHIMFPGTRFIRTLHVPKKVKNTIVRLPRGVKCATQGNCSQMLSSCLQRNIDSCEGGEFRDD